MQESLFNNSDYQDLFAALESSIYSRVPATGPKIGRYREAVFYQIDHGQGHMRRVRANMETMLRCGKGKLEDIHLFVALTAAAFHDLGMHFGWYLVDSKIKEPLTFEHSKIIRRDHGKIAALFFNSITTDSCPSELNINPKQHQMLADPWLKKCLAFIIEHYSLPLSGLNKRLDSDFDLADRERLRFIACLLKLADVLDMDARRVQAGVLEDLMKQWTNESSIMEGMIGDVKRLLLVSYFYRGELEQVSEQRLLRFNIKLKVPGVMFESPKYRDLLDYFHKRYKSRLHDDEGILTVLRDYAGIEFTNITVPPFEVDASQPLIPEALLSELYRQLRLFDCSRSSNGGGPDGPVQPPANPSSGNHRREESPPSPLASEHASMKSENFSDGPAHHRPVGLFDEPARQRPNFGSNHSANEVPSFQQISSDDHSCSFDQKAVLADRGQRLSSLLLDGLVLLVMMSPFIYGLDSVFFKKYIYEYAALVGVLVSVNLFLLVRNGQSIGKNLVGIKIVKKNGERAELWRILVLRIFVLYIIFLIPILGYLILIVDPLMIFRESRRCLHDEIASTIVIVA